MSVTEQELRAELRNAYQLKDSAAKFAQIDGIIRHADAAGLDQFAFDTRLDAIGVFNRGGDHQRGLLAFSACLATLQRQPELVQPHAHGQLMWSFKWIPALLTRFPGIDYGQVQQVFNQMDHHFSMAGYSQHAIFQYRMHVAVHTGHHDDARHWHDQLLTARRDTMSDCAACIPSYLIECYEETGQYEQAVTCAEASRHLRCNEQPQWILTHALAPYVMTGRYEQAAEAHRSVYPRMRSGPTWLHGIALHLVMCGLTGNQARGLELIERHLEWLDVSPSPFQTMEFASAAALILRLLTDAGQEQLTVRDRRSGRQETTVGNLHAELAQTASAIAAKFDIRNGNTFQRNRIHTRMSLTPLTSLVVL